MSMTDEEVAEKAESIGLQSAFVSFHAGESTDGKFYVVLKFAGIEFVADKYPFATMAEAMAFAHDLGARLINSRRLN